MSRGSENRTSTCTPRRLERLHARAKGRLTVPTGRRGYATVGAVLTLLLVDDHASFRAAARAALSERFTVVGEAADGPQAVALARQVRPDVALVDVQLPGLDGFAVAVALSAQEDPPQVVLTSSRDRRDLEPLLRTSPARGFIAKERLSVTSLEELLL